MRLARQLADSKGGLEYSVESRSDRLTIHSRAIGLANLAQNLPFAQNKTLQAGRHPKQMTDSPFVVITYKVPGKESDCTPCS